MNLKFLITLLLPLLISSLAFASDIDKKAFASDIYQKISKLQTGDIVFQEVNNTQGLAVKAATDSSWTHVGIIYFIDDKPFVIEAIQPVSVTPLHHFIARNPNSFHPMRLKNNKEIFTTENLMAAASYVKSQLGKNYDNKFLWNNDRIYCSEHVWKVYKKAANIELCKPRAMKSYNLQHPIVQKIITQRYDSTSNLPLDELVVAPSDIAESELLVTIH